MSSQRLGGKGKVISHSEQSCPRLLRHTRSLRNWHWALKSPAWLSHIISQLSLTMAWASTQACMIWPSAASPNSSPAASCAQSNRSHCRLLLVPWTQLGKTAFAHALPSAWIFVSAPSDESVLISWFWHKWDFLKEAFLDTSFLLSPFMGPLWCTSLRSYL